jgi:transposase-like protein
MADREAAHSARIPVVVPRCKKCGNLSTVRPVHLIGIDPNVQYWRCQGCGFVWATRDDEHLSAADGL